MRVALNAQAFCSVLISLSFSLFFSVSSSPLSPTLSAMFWAVAVLLLLSAPSLWALTHSLKPNNSMCSLHTCPTLTRLPLNPSLSILALFCFHFSSSLISSNSFSSLLSPSLLLPSVLLFSTPLLFFSFLSLSRSPSPSLLSSALVLRGLFRPRGPAASAGQCHAGRERHVPAHGGD